MVVCPIVCRDVEILVIIIITELFDATILAN